MEQHTLILESGREDLLLISIGLNAATFEHWNLILMPSSMIVDHTGAVYVTQNFES